MNINKTEENKIEIDGAVNTIQNYQEIKGEVESMLSMGITDVHIVLRNTPSLTSSIIGYLIKVRAVNRATVTLHVASDQLYELLEQLNLTSSFNVIRV
jgi:hypothetical protein